MGDSFYKFPSTPHLRWLGSAPVRDDKVLSTHETNKFLAGEVTIEEKLDGANLGLSFDSAGVLRFQNRGSWLTGQYTGQWVPLRAWASYIEPSLRTHLPDRHIVFGEWCYAKHSIIYDKLPDWFLGFDVYNVDSGTFWDTVERNALFLNVGICPVPMIGRGQYTIMTIESLLSTKSIFASHSEIEGVYLRHEARGVFKSRAKLVRPSFHQSINQHWTSSQLTKNRLSGFQPLRSVQGQSC